MRWIPMAAGTVAALAATINCGGGGGSLGPGGGGGGGGGGRGTAVAGAGIADPGYPPGFNPRPAESRSAPDSSQTPEAVRRRLESSSGAPGGGGPGGGQGGGGGGFGANRPVPAATGDYRIVVIAGDQTSVSTVRVVATSPEETSVLLPTRR